MQNGLKADTFILLTVLTCFQSKIAHIVRSKMATKHLNLKKRYILAMILDFNMAAILNDVDKMT